MCVHVCVRACIHACVRARVHACVRACNHRYYNPIAMCQYYEFPLPGGYSIYGVMCVCIAYVYVRIIGLCGISIIIVYRDIFSIIAIQYFSICYRNNCHRDCKRV